MIRKNTWIALIFLGLILAVAWYLEWSPMSKSRVRGTPTATTFPNSFAWNVQDLAIVTFTTNNTKESVGIRRNLDDSWGFIQQSDRLVDQGVAEQIVAEIQSIKTQDALDPNIDLVALGILNPIYTINLKMADNNEFDFKIGDLIPTGNGYYAQINNESPIVISKGSVDSIVEIFNLNSLTMATPTPFPTQTQ